MKHMNKERIQNSMENWSFTYVNYWLFFIGITFILIGYLIMYMGGVNSFQTLSLSPALLVIGYCIIIPISIFYKK